ncbi:hypothetical protein Tco_0934001 [Tanacetum coccineum]
MEISIWSFSSSGELKFRNRVFPNKIGFSITNLDIIGVIEDEEIFGKLSDDDAIRLCLLLALEGEHLWCHLYDEIKNLKERHGDEHYYGLFKDRNYVPTYTLSGFVFAFQIWILETFERCESWWIKDPKVIPRALGWSKKSLFTRSDYPFLFAKESRSTSDLRPTIAEYQSSWWIDNNLYFQEFVPRAPPIKEHHGLLNHNFQKLEKTRKNGKPVSWFHRCFVDPMKIIGQGLSVVRDTYVSCQHLTVRCEERHEQILELKILVGSTVVAESVQLPVVLEHANIFQKNEIDPSKYTITFRLADNVPKQGGIYGDCGVWVCILLYRLAYGLSLDVDDPVDVALAYREKMV